MYSLQVFHLSGKLILGLYCGLDLFTDHQVYESRDVVSSVLSQTPPIVLRYMAGAQKTFAEG